MFKERLRLGVPALFRFLKTEGYDIGGYSAKNYSMDDIQRYFAWCRVKIDGIVTGVGRMERSSEVKKKLETRIKSQYPHIIHIDRLTLLRTSTASRGYEEFPLSGEALTWSQEVMDIVGALEKHEK